MHSSADLVAASVTTRGVCVFLRDIAGSGRIHNFIWYRSSCRTVPVSNRGRNAGLYQSDCISRAFNKYRLHNRGLVARGRWMMAQEWAIRRARRKEDAPIDDK